MTDDGPNYSRNIVNRRQIVPVVGIVFFATTLSALAFGLDDAPGQSEDGSPTAVLKWYAFELVRVPVAENTHANREAAIGDYRIGFVVAFAVVALTAGVGGGYAAGSLHRSFWPEHPDEE